VDYIRDNKDKPFIYKKPFDYTVEIHLTHMCNFFCSGCSHYSNYKLNGYLSTERFKHYLETWSDKFNQLPLEFRLLGGEPTLHRNLVELIELSRKYMPDNNILLFTNGTYLHKHKNLKDVLIDNKIVLKLTDHSQEKKYRDKIDPIREILLKWSDEGLDYRSYDYSTDFGFSSEATDKGGGRGDNTSIWRKQYKGDGVTMRPFEDNEPKKSYEICCCSWAKGGIANIQLYENKLWKCQHIAYLKDVLTKFGLQTHPKWTPYLKYKPLSSNVTFDEMVSWMKREEEDVCNMCPAYDDKRETVLDKDVFGERRYA